MYQQWGSDPLLHRQHHAILGLHPHSCGAKLQIHSTFSCVSVLYKFEVMAGSQPNASLLSSRLDTLMASIAYSTWKMRPSGLKVFTPLSYSLLVRNIAQVACEPAIGFFATLLKDEMDELLKGDSQL